MSTVKAANLQNTGSGAPVFKNSSGTEIGQLCKAWVNFNGTGTVAIRDDFNVSSITDNGTGDYTVTFTNAMPDTNYSVTGSCTWSNASYGNYQAVDASTYSTTAVRMHSVYTNSSGFIHVDSLITSMQIFGG